MNADLATLRALATQARDFDADDLSDIERDLLTRDTGAAMLTVLDEVEVLRAQVAKSAARIERLAAMNKTEIAQRFIEATRVAPPVPPPGFTGTRLVDLGSAVDGAHVVRLALYRFHDGSTMPCVELHETHDGARPGRVMALSTLVHLAQNATDAEVWAIGNREPTT